MSLTYPSPTYPSFHRIYSPDNCAKVSENKYEAKDRPDSSDLQPLRNSHPDFSMAKREVEKKCTLFVLYTLLFVYLLYFISQDDDILFHLTSIHEKVPVEVFIADRILEIKKKLLILIVESTIFRRSRITGSLLLICWYQYCHSHYLIMVLVLVPVLSQSLLDNFLTSS